MVTCCSDEVVDLISTYFRTSIGVESIQIIGVDDTATKIAKIHHYNFTRGTSVLIYNTRAGELPLTPKKVEKIIIYEEELISESRDTLKQKTIPRCCPATVVRLVCEGTIEEKIRSFSPKITENKIHGVHALLIDVPEEQTTSRSSSRSARNQKTWQSMLYEALVFENSLIFLDFFVLENFRKPDLQNMTNRAHRNHPYRLKVIRRVTLSWRRLRTTLWKWSKLSRFNWENSENCPRTTSGLKQFHGLNRTSFYHLRKKFTFQGKSIFIPRKILGHNRLLLYSSVATERRLLDKVKCFTLG